jgi:hypothetical protein
MKFFSRSRSLFVDRENISLNNTHTRSEKFRQTRNVTGHIARHAFKKCARAAQNSASSLLKRPAPPPPLRIHTCSVHGAKKMDASICKARRDGNERVEGEAGE